MVDLPDGRSWSAEQLELIRAKLGIELSEQSVGNYLKRWNLTPQ